LNSNSYITFKEINEAWTVYESMEGKYTFIVSLSNGLQTKYMGLTKQPVMINTQQGNTNLGMLKIPETGSIHATINYVNISTEELSKSNLDLYIKDSTGADIAALVNSPGTPELFVNNAPVGEFSIVLPNKEYSATYSPQKLEVTANETLEVTIQISPSQ
jgi:hypothetical protein